MTRDIAAALEDAKWLVQIAAERSVTLDWLEAPASRILSALERLDRMAEVVRQAKEIVYLYVDPMNVKSEHEELVRHLADLSAKSDCG